MEHDATVPSSSPSDSAPDVVATEAKTNGQDRAYPFSLPLYDYTPEASHTIGDACQHVCVLGRTGAGKSSGPGRAFAVSYLLAGFGGLVLCAKGDEPEVWRRYAQEAGREDDLVIFSADADHRFNFFAYEYERSGRGSGRTVNLHRLLSTLIESMQMQDAGGGGDEAFWQYTLDQLIRRTIDLVLLAGERPTLQTLYSVVMSAPREEAQVKVGPREERANDPHLKWKRESRCFRLLVEAAKRREELTPQQLRDLHITRLYFEKDFPNLSEKTRSIIVSYFSSMLDLMLTGDLGELFGTETNVTPEDCFEGKIIVVDLPTLEYFDLGKMAAGIWKYMFQRAVLAREMTSESRPVFLWADEAHQFLSPFDQEYMAQCRSKSGAVVYLCQNLPLFENVLGTSADVYALLGNFKTLVFMANNESDTNEWAAQTIGKSWMVHPDLSLGNQMDPDTVGPRAGTFLRQSERFEVQPNEFTKLKTGGPQASWQVEAIIFRGEPFGADLPYLRALFAQR